MLWLILIMIGAALTWYGDDQSKDNVMLVGIVIVIASLIVFMLRMCATGFWV